MTRAAFFFISSILMLLPIALQAGDIPMGLQLGICLPLILLLGIPHGAIDNVLYLRKNKQKNTQFILVYLFIVVLNIGLWMLLPSFAYLLFLLLSAYHFGQSQFSHYVEKQVIIHQALYLFWGITLLAALVYFKLGEINLIFQNNEEFAHFAPLHQKTFMFFTFIISLGMTLWLLLYLTFKKALTIAFFAMEVIEMGLILLCFYLMPLLIGFTLYFVILHSFKVMREEYEFLRSEQEVNSLISFTKVLAPFTLLSIAGIAFMLSLVYFNLITVSYGYVLLIIISSITLPHVFVMEHFYQLLASKKLPSQVH